MVHKAPLIHHAPAPYAPPAPYVPPKVEKTSTKIGQKRKSSLETIQSDVIKHSYPQAVHKPVHHAPAHHGPARPFQYNYGVADSYRYYSVSIAVCRY